MTNLNISDFKKDISLGDLVTINLKPGCTEYSMLGKGLTYFPKGMPFPASRILHVTGIYSQPSSVDNHPIDQFIRLYDADARKFLRVHPGAGNTYTKHDAIADFKSDIA